jgi:hypothetical protein
MQDVSQLTRVNSEVGNIFSNGNRCFLYSTEFVLFGKIVFIQNGAVGIKTGYGLEYRGVVFESL